MNTFANIILESLQPDAYKFIDQIIENGIINEETRIQHAEDVIFWEGSAGAKRVLKSFLNLQQEGYKNLTVKWDGSPAIIFGRNQAGQFVLTDKSGFFAKGYQGKVTSANDLEKMFLARGKDSPKSDQYKTFAADMKFIFSVFEQAVPSNYRGYFKGDLLYFKQPPIINNNFVFKPNIVTYHVDVNSDLGKNIAKSITAVVLHRKIDETGQEYSLTADDFNVFQGDKLLVIKPITVQKAPVIDKTKITEAVSLLHKHGANIDKMLNSSTLSKLKLTDFPDTLYKYVNSKIGAEMGELGKDFDTWLTSNAKITEVKRKNMLQYIAANRVAFDSLWQVFNSIMAVKEDIIRQLDQQNLPIKSYIGDIPSGEGYVLSQPDGDIKFVSRPTFTTAHHAIYKKSIAEGGWLKPELTAKTKITPYIVNEVFDKVKVFIKDFNGYLSAKKLVGISDFKILGSAKYFQQDLVDNPNAQYGDIDVMFVLPETESEENEAKVKTVYSKLIVDFVKSSTQDYIDKESAERSSGKQLIIKINDTEWVQIDLLFTFKKYGDWFSARFSPQRGLKGFVVGNLYSALAETLNIRISDRGVRAKFKDGQIVNPLLRKGTIDKLITTNPTTFLFDIFVFLAKLFDVQYKNSDIDANLLTHKGINPSDIKFESIATGILGLIKTLDKTGILSKLNTNYNNFISTVKNKYVEKNDENVKFKSTKATDATTLASLEKIKNDATIGLNIVKNILKESLLMEGGESVAANSKVPIEHLQSTVKNALKLYKLDSIKYSIIGNVHKKLLGDIDVATSVKDLEDILKVSYEVDKKEFYKKLDSYISRNTPSSIPTPAYKVVSGLDQVSINVPIVDDNDNFIKSTDKPDENGFVQLDLMIGDVDFMSKALSGATNSKYKAALRNLLLMNIMRYSYESTDNPSVRTRYQFNWKKGLQKLDVITNAKGKEEKANIKTISNNMDDVAVFLFGPNHTFDDINTFEKLFKLVDSSSFRYKEHKDKIIADFKNEIKKLGFEL